MLDFHHGKTAASILRYQPDSVLAVIDSENSGRTTNGILGLGNDTPVYQEIEETFALNPTELLIGIAPKGGELPVEWRRQVLTAIDHGLDIVSGLHYMLGDDEEFASAARRYNVRIVDVRRAPTETRVAEMLPRRPGSHVITFVGSDCAVGKMTAALEVTAAARERGLRTGFVATGQTGIMLSGDGVAVDRVIGDFMAGAIESLVVKAAADADWVFVEGQGSLLHPGYSGVTLALLHGSLPDAMILVHPPGHDQIDGYAVTVPPLDQLVAIYEQAASWVKPCRVVAIALNTRALSADETERAIVEAEGITGLPATDPVKFGCGKIIDALLSVEGR